MTDENLPVGEDEHVKTTADHKVRHKDQKVKIKLSKGENMQMQPTYPAMVASGSGDGLGGGGLLGAILAMSMLNRNNGLGNGFGENGGFGREREGCVTPTQLTAGLAGVTDALQNTTVMGALGDIKASIPLAEGQQQLALAQAQAAIIAQTNQLSSQNDNLFAQTNKGISDAIAASLASQGNINVNVLTTAATTQAAILNSKFELANHISADGAATRALISSIETANTQRLLGERQDEITELRAQQARSEDRRGIEINMTNNQTQNQLQFQQQQQVLNSLTSCINGLAQNIQATNQAINIGGFQQANPTNTNTNVRA